MLDLPSPVAALVRALVAMPDAAAVALVGSRALRSADAVSDWDLGLYYRGTIDLTPLTAFGDVHGRRYAPERGSNPRAANTLR